MKLNQYINQARADILPVSIKGNEIDDVYFRRLSAGEGLQLKEAFSGLLNTAGSAAASIAKGDAEEAGAEAAAKLSPAQLKALFEFQALFAFLHLGVKDGSRAYTDRKVFDDEVPDEFVQAFYQAGSEHKQKTEHSAKEAEGNS